MKRLFVSIGTLFFVFSLSGCSLQSLSSSSTNQSSVSNRHVQTARSSSNEISSTANSNVSSTSSEYDQDISVTGTLLKTPTVDLTCPIEITIKNTSETVLQASSIKIRKTSYDGIAAQTVSDMQNTSFDDNYAGYQWAVTTDIVPGNTLNCEIGMVPKTKGAHNLTFEFYKADGSAYTTSDGKKIELDLTLTAKQ